MAVIAEPLGDDPFAPVHRSHWRGRHSTRRPATGLPQSECARGGCAGRCGRAGRDESCRRGAMTRISRWRSKLPRVCR